MRRHPSAVAAFTLVELLVVIGIITVLIAILLPVLARVRQQAYEVKCATNLRAIGQGIELYVQDSGHYPTPMYLGPTQAFRYVACWPVQVRRAMRGGTGAFHCPARGAEWAWEKRFGPPGQAVGTHSEGDVFAGVLETTIGYELGERLVSDWGRPYWFSHGYNGGSRGLGRHVLTVGGSGGPQILGWRWETRRANQVRRPTEMIAAGDGTGGFGLSRSVIADVHRGGVNILFCDGHVQWYAQRDLNTATAQGANNARMWNADNQP